MNNNGREESFLPTTFKYKMFPQHSNGHVIPEINDSTEITDSLLIHPDSKPEAKHTTPGCPSWLILSFSVVTIVTLCVLCQDYIRWTLSWLENEDPWVVCGIFLILYTMVSLPFMWGYFMLNIATGYLFGFVNGMLVTVSTAAVGIWVAHIFIRTLLKDFVLRKLITSDYTKAVLNVLSGSRALKVVMFARLTPIPFGLQNAIFAVSSYLKQGSRLDPHFFPLEEEIHSSYPNNV